MDESKSLRKRRGYSSPASPTLKLLEPEHNATTNYVNAVAYRARQVMQLALFLSLIGAAIAIGYACIISEPTMRLMAEKGRALQTGRPGFKRQPQRRAVFLLWPRVDSDVVSGYPAYVTSAWCVNSTTSVTTTAATTTTTATALFSFENVQRYFRSVYGRLVCQSAARTLRPETVAVLTGPGPTDIPAMLYKAGAGTGTMNVLVHDAHAAAVASPGLPVNNIFTGTRDYIGAISVNLKSDNNNNSRVFLSTARALLAAHGFEVGVYTVDETVYTDYGEYAGNATHGWSPGRARDWPSGTRSPGIVALTSFPRKPGMSERAWKQWWHGVQSPMSEIMQPRARYVRNRVVVANAPHKQDRNAGESDDTGTIHPSYAGIVAESWPSAAHVTNKFLFFGASSTWELIINMCVMLRSVSTFLPMAHVETVTMSEYFIDVMTA